MADQRSDPNGIVGDGAAETVTLWRDLNLATMAGPEGGIGRIEAGAIVTKGGSIVYAGPEADLPEMAGEAMRIVEGEGRWATPGLVDCHTHLVFAGNRAKEFEQRLAGASYEEIARAGGGIVSSVRGVRAASEDDLVTATLPRLDALIAEGVTTIEVKSGYGLDTASELKSLRAARRLAKARDVEVLTTFLGAHALPPEARGDKGAYIETVCRDMLPAVAAEGLADAVDGFCEGIAFSPDEIARVFAAAKAHNLPIKLHAEQLSDLGGAALAARHGALSADHLEYLSEEGAREMAKAGTIAVLLPGAFYFIRERRVPPIDLMRRHGVAIALATDCNPGTSPLTSLLLTMNMAATFFRMTVDECLLAVTRNGARALGLLAEIGTLEAGKRADFCLWDIDDPAELVYRIGFNPLYRRVRGGK